MVSRGWRIALLVVLGSLLLVSAGVAWLGWSRAGASWLVTTVARLLPGDLTVAAVEGRLADHLQLSGLRFRSTSVQLELHRLDLRWQPFGLLQGELTIPRLGLAGLDISLPATTPAVAAPAPGALADRLIWPHLDPRLRWLQAKIESLEVTAARVTGAGEASLDFERLTARVVWHGGSLELHELDLEGADGRLQGDGTLDLVGHAAKIQLALRPAAGGRLTGVPRGEVALTLDGGGDGAAVRGTLQASAAWGEEPPLQLATGYLLQGNDLILSSLELRRKGIPGRASGSGRCRLAGAATALDLDLELHDVDLEDLTRFPMAISGTLAGRLDSSGYRGRFRLANAGSSWRELALAGRFAGNWGGIALRELQGAWLAGTVQGELDIGWESAPSLVLDLAGRRLDPERLRAGLPGAIDLDLKGRIDFPRERPVTADWQAAIAPSRLLGRSLQGEVAGRFDGESLLLRPSRLQGEGYRLAAQGRLADRIHIDLQVSDLGGLLPDAAGSGALAGWVRWRPAEGWSSQGKAAAQQLTWQDWHLASLAGEAAWLAEESRMAIAVTARELGKGAWGAENLQISGAGRVERHSLAVSAAWPGGGVELRFAGGWQQQEWRGRLLTLTAQDQKYGDWNLQTPVELQLGSERLAWTSFTLSGAEGQYLASNGRLNLAPLDGGFALDIARFNLGWISPWLAEVELAGHVDGYLTLHWTRGRLDLLTAGVTGQGAFQGRRRRLEIPELEGALTWSEKGLKGDWTVNLGAAGNCKGEVDSGDLPMLALPERGKLAARWRDLDLSLANRWLRELALGGRSSGEGNIAWQADRSLALHLQMEATPQLQFGQSRIALSRAAARLDWDRSGLQGEVSLEESLGGHLDLRLQSPDPARVGWPQQGHLAFSAAAIDLALVRPWIPPEMSLSGALQLSGTADWQPGKIFSASGLAAIDGGRWAWRSGNREVEAPLKAARLDWTWKGAALTGALALELGDRGRLQGKGELAVPARWPLAVSSRTDLQGSLQGNFREDGLLSALFPGMIQESRGELALDLAVSGNLKEPEVSGTADLQGGGGYLPAAGLHLHDAGVRLRLEKDRLLAEAFQVGSGAGVLQGSGELELHGLTPGAYHFALRGEKVQAVDLPELQLAVSPDLEVAGQGARMEVTGVLQVPDALFRGRQGKAPVVSSPDLVIVDAAATEQAPSPLHMALKVTVRLGDRVFVKAAGIDARLSGEVLVRGEDLRGLSGQGRIDVAEGNYATYGVKLAITRGTVVFAGGPIEDPALDILALRELEEVKAGVRVTGTPRAPQVRLYSEPAMPDTDILAYIVLGHPLGGDSGQASLMLAAAGALLSQGDSVVLQDRLKRQLGIDVIDVKTVNGDTTQSVVTIGKYLSPQLYISFGQSVFNNTSEVGVRYDISDRWQLESNVGVESGVDLYYRIRFE